MVTLTVATTNRHKAREIAEILEPLGIEVLVPDDLPGVIEDGASFAENARKKAVESAAFLGRRALADDSGLEVEALGGEPGIRSARFAGPGATSADNNALLIRRLEALGLVDPAAAFVCHAVVAAPDGRIVAEATGRVEGVLRWPAAGGGGFGYDPLFHHPPSGCRFSELAAGRKNAVSHRGRALRALATLLTDA
jgi:XTP/dITP diphosphohydrolase